MEPGKTTDAQQRPGIILFILVLFIPVFLGLGCKETKLVEKWEDQAYDALPLKTVLVLGLFTSQEHRKTWEDGLASALTSGGTKGIPGHTLMPDPKDYDEQDEIKAAVKSLGADGVIVATLRGVTKENKHIPSRVTYVRSPSVLYDYYGASYDQVYHPGYTVSDTIVRLKIALFSVDTQKMVWEGTTKSVNPSSDTSITRDTSRVVIKEMKRAGLL